MADPSAPGVPSLFNFSDPNTTALLGAIQGLGAASAPSRLPVTGGMVFGSLAGGMLSGAEQGAKMRAMDTTQIGEAAKAQQMLDNMTIGRQWLGQSSPSPDDLLHNRYQQLMAAMPNPSATQSAPGSLAPAVSVGGATRGTPSAPAPSFDPAALVQKYENDGGNPYLGVGGTDLSKAPLDAHGFPIWEGKDGSHAAGLYGFQPATYAKYSDQLGIKDFSPASQRAVFNLAYLNEGFSPWSPYNPRLARAIAATPGALDGEPILPGRPNGYDQYVQREAAAGQGAPLAAGTAASSTGAPGPAQARASAAPPAFGSLAAGGAGRGAVPPIMQQIMGMRYLGMSPPGVVTDLMTAQMMPPGQARDLAMATAYKNAGLGPQNVRQGGGLWQVGPDGQYHMSGQMPVLSKDQMLSTGPNGQLQTNIIPGALQDIGQLAAAEAGGKKGGELPYAGPTAQAAAGGRAAGELPYEQPLAYQAALGTGRATPQEFPGPFGREYLGPRSLIAGVGGDGQPESPTFGNLAGGGALPLAGISAPPSSPAPTSNLVPGGALPLPTTALTAGLANAINPPRRPESAQPTFPVQTPTGPKDISTLNLGDMFPGGQGIPTPPAPPPGMAYGKPSETEEQVQKDDATRVEGYAKEASENQKIYQDVGHLSDVLGRGLNTTHFAPLLAQMTNIAQGLGLPKWTIPSGANPNDAAVFDKASTDLVFAAVKKLAGQVRVAEITGYMRANPSLTMPVAANMNILNDVLSSGKWQDARARLASQYVTATGGAPLAAFDARFNQMAPLADVTDNYKQAVRQTPSYQAGLKNGIGFPEDVGINAPTHTQPGAPEGATDSRMLNGKMYYKIGSQWVQ